MAKNIQSLKPDTVVKNYWRNNDQFADLFNAVLFNGKQIIKAEELEDTDTEESSVLEHKGYAESLQASRDHIKISKRSSAHGVEFVLLGLEHQEHIHYAMPLRVMGYDYGTYKKQYDNNARMHKAAKDLKGDEYLSKMKKDDKFMPIITITVYYGELPWDGSTSLHEMLHIPKEMKQFVNDYKMLLVEARKNKLSFHNINNVDLFNLFQIILDRSTSKQEAREKTIKYCEEHHTDKSVIMTIAGAANIKIDYNAFEKGDGNVCTLFEEIEKESELKGELRGELKGKLKGIQALIKSFQKLNIPYQTTQEHLMENFSISNAEAQKYLEQYWK